MKRFFLLLIAAAAVAANVIFPGNKIAALMLAVIFAVILFINILPRLILWAIKMDEKHDRLKREKLIKKKAKEKKEREERLDKICREVPQERLS